MDSADTRFHNDRVRAAQRSMVGNQAAASSLRPTSSRHKSGSPLGPPVGAPNPVQQVLNTPTPAEPRNAPSNPPRPTGPPPNYKPMYGGQSGQPDAEAAPQIPPELQNMMTAVHADRMINSHDTTQAYTKVALRDHFYGRDSGSAGRAQQVLEIVNANGPRQ